MRELNIAMPRANQLTLMLSKAIKAKNLKLEVYAKQVTLMLSEGIKVKLKL